MTNNQLRRCILVLGLLLTAAAGVPSAGAQGLSGADTTAVNNLLGTGVLGAALPASPIANPATLMPLSPGTWVFQFTGGPNQGTTETDSLQANTQLGADSQWQWTAGQTTIYDLSTANDGSIVSPSEQDLTQGVVTQYTPFRPVLLPGMQPGVPQTTTLQVNVYNIGDLSTVTQYR